MNFRRSILGAVLSLGLLSSAPAFAQQVSSSSAPPTLTVTYTSTQAVTVPVWASRVFVTGCAAGGGGGGGQSSASTAGGGGGSAGSGVIDFGLPVTPASTLTLVINGGGAGGGPGINGTTPGATSISGFAGTVTMLSFTPGPGGSFGTGAVGGAGGAGAGVGGAAAPAGGAVGNSAAFTVPSFFTGATGAGGGATAGNAGNFGGSWTGIPYARSSSSASVGGGGPGGNSIFGSGQNGPAVNTAPTGTAAPCAGGAGAGANQTGGTGGGGQIVLTFQQ